MEIKITWLGHAAFLIEGVNKKIYIDPWIENPKSPIKLNEIKKADLVLVTHDHFDHVGQAEELIKKTNATLIANVETAQKFKQQGIPQKNIANDGFGLNIGGSIKFDDLIITMTQAYHSTATGVATGYVLRFPQEVNIYHAGDTGIFSEMELIAKLYPLTVALLPIGGIFTMDAYQAAQALTLLRPKVAIPMHYATFPIIAQDAQEFILLSQKIAPNTKIVVLKPGESYEI